MHGGKLYHKSININANKLNKVTFIFNQKNSLQLE